MKHLKTLQFTCLVCLSMLLMVSCKKKNEAGKFIPGNAAAVAVFDGVSLTKKLSWEEIKQGEMFKQAYLDSSLSQMAKSVMDNPENTGLDVKNNITVFVVKDSSGGYGAVTGIIKDAAKFKNYLTAIVKDGVTSTSGKIQFITKDDYTLSWNEDRFYMVSEIKGLDNNPMPGGMDFPTDTTRDMDSVIIPVKSTMNLTAIAEKLYQIEAKNSLTENEKFGEVMSKEGDIKFWINVEALQSNSMGMAAMAMLNVGKLTKDSYYTGVANFEDGKVVMDIMSYSGKELSALWKKHEGDDMDTKIIAQSPIKDPAVLISMNYQPKGLKALLELTGLEGFANLGATKFGFTVDDFINGQNGKMLIVIGDVTKDSSGKMEPKGFFTVGIKDKVAFAKIIAAAKKEAGMVPAGKAEYAVNDNNFAIGTPGIATAYLNGKSNNNYTFLDKIKGGPVGGFINIDYLLNNTRSSSNPTAMDSLNVAMWDNMIFNGGKFVDGGITQHLELNMKDKKTNALKQLNTYINKMAVEEKKRKELMEKEGPKMDEVVAAPVMY